MITSGNINSSNNNNSSSLIEDELIEEMTKINNSDDNHEPFLNRVEAAIENIRITSQESSPRRNSNTNSNINSINVTTENYNVLVEKLKVEKQDLENEKYELLQQENLLKYSKRQNFDLLTSTIKQAKASPHTPKFSSPLLKVSRSPTVELLSEELMKAQQSVEVAEALAGSHQKVIQALKEHTDSGDYSKSPEKMKNFQASVQYVEQEIMNKWTEEGYKKSAEVDHEYIQSLKNAHAEVLEENLELKRNIDDYSLLKQKYSRLQEQYKARSKAMMQVKKRQDDAWQFALRALEDKAILQANAHAETIKRLTKQLAKAQELLKSNEFNSHSGIIYNGDTNNRDVDVLATKCMELESYIIQARKDNIELKSENISLKEKLVTATELGKDALRHAEEKEYLLQSHTKTDEKKLQWLEHGNKKLLTKLEQLTAQNDLLKAELYEKNKIASDVVDSNRNNDAKDKEIAFLKEQLDMYLSEVQQANVAVNGWMVENAELKREKVSAIERLEMANKLSEEYKELVVQMQGKLAKGGSDNGVAIDKKETNQEEEEEIDEIMPLVSGNITLPDKSKLKRRLSDVRSIFNTAVRLKLATDLKAVFGVLDKDHDGTISMDELKKGLIKMRVEMDDIEIKYLWDALNVHHNESISYSDFEHFCHSKSVIAQAAKIGARKRMSRVVFSEAATVGKAQTNRRSSLVLIKSAGEAAAKMALKKIHRREERDKIKSEMHKSVSLAAQLGKQKSLVRSVATNTAIIGKQKSLIRKVASEVALLGQKKRHGRNVASHAAEVATVKKRRRSVAADAASLANALSNIKCRRASISKQTIKELRIPDSPITVTSDMQINRRISEVRTVFNTAVRLKLATDLKAVFGVLDKDHDGTISMDELKKGLIKMRVEMDDIEIKYLWDALNVHHNESISYSDFEHFCHSKSVIAQAAAVGIQKRTIRDAAIHAAQVASSKDVVKSKTGSSPQQKMRLQTVIVRTKTTSVTRTTVARGKKRRKRLKGSSINTFAPPTGTYGTKSYIKNTSASFAASNENNVAESKKLKLSRSIKHTTGSTKTRKLNKKKIAPASKSILNADVNKPKKSSLIIKANTKVQKSRTSTSKGKVKNSKNVSISNSRVHISKKNNSNLKRSNVPYSISIANNSNIKHVSNKNKKDKPKFKVDSRKKILPNEENNNNNTKAAVLLKSYKPVVKRSKINNMRKKANVSSSLPGATLASSSLSKSSVAVSAVHLKKARVVSKRRSGTKSKSTPSTYTKPKEKIKKKDLSLQLIPKIKMEDIPDKPFKELLSSPHKPVVLKDYKSYTIDEYKWLDKGMSPSKVKVKYQAYKGPIGEINVKSSFGKQKNTPTSSKKKGLPYDSADISKLLDNNNDGDVVKVLSFKDNSKNTNATRIFKDLKLSKPSPYADKKKKTAPNPASLSLSKYEMSKRARRLNYKPVLDDDGIKMRKKKTLKTRNKLLKSNVNRSVAKKPQIDDAVHNPANVALSPPPSLPPSRSSAFFADNSEGDTTISLRTQSPELSMNDIKKLEDDVTKLFRKNYRRLRKTKKKNLPNSKIHQLRKEFGSIKYGYASKYVISQTKSIRKQKVKIKNQLRSLRKKQKMLDDSIQNLNIDGSPIPYSITGFQAHAHTETHGRGHDGLDDHNGKPFK